jgi:hypothetical protein
VVERRERRRVGRREEEIGSRLKEEEVVKGMAAEDERRVG